jgi:predicted negative regulator of RcsB-dependent stress response
MATHLDLEEQEQLDRVKHFWKQWGNPITWLLVIVLGSYAAWMGWRWYERDQGVKAAALYDELDRAVREADAAKVERAFGDLRQRFGSTAFTQQGALLAARFQAEQGQTDAAIATLTWAADKADEAEYRTVARLRLAGLLLDQKKHDEALKQLDAANAAGFEALVQDRRGDVLAAMGRNDEAIAAWTKAWQTLDERVEYRRLIEGKLTAAGAPPAAKADAAAASGGKP